MDHEKIIKIAIKEGFADAAIVDTADIVFEASFRPYCEENLCGQYGANYSCPPDCGTPKEMEQKVRNHKHALVLRTVWDINNFKDSNLIKSAKQKHNAYTISVIERMENNGYKGFMVGASGCSLCNPCLITEGKTCKFPNQRYSCMSAYCIYVKDLADKCDMVYDYKEGALPFFSMYVEHLKENNSAATIQSDLSGIRYFHRKSGSKNRLSKNDKLSLPKRATGVKDHSWLKSEIDNMRQLATKQDRQLTDNKTILR